MKKTLIALFALGGMAMALDTPSPIAEWNDFSSMTSNDYTISTSGNSRVSDNILYVSGAANGTANIDLTGKGLTFANGLSVAMLVSDVKDGTSGKYPTGLLSFMSNSENFYALAGIGLTSNDNMGGFACKGSTGNITVTNRADVSVLRESTPTMAVATFASNSFSLYVDGDLVATGVPKGGFSADQVLTKLSFGSWAGNSGSGVLSEKIYSLAIYDTALTAEQVKSLSIPEPTTGTLSLLALAGLCARRRKK